MGLSKIVGAVVFAAALILSQPAANAAVYPAGCYASSSSSWGQGRICYNSSGWYTETKDIQTDGYCVYSKYLNGSSWITIPNSKSCTNSVKQSSYFPRNVVVRVYREDGRYFTLGS